MLFMLKHRVILFLSFSSRAPDRRSEKKHGLLIADLFSQESLEQRGAVLETGVIHARPVYRDLESRRLF
jgi:hypothetical protein